MRPCNVLAIPSQTAATDANGVSINTSFVYAASGQLVASGASAAGSFKVQVSNDNVEYPFLPTNWSNLGSAVSISGAGTYLIQKFDMAYAHLRAVYTSTVTGTQNITTVADSTGLQEISRAATNADTGQLANVLVTVPATAAASQGDYFVIYGTGGLYAAVWLDINAAGIVPTGAAYVAATNKIKVSIVTGGTAIQNGALVAAAMAGIQGYSSFDNGNGTCSEIQTLMGATTAPATHDSSDSGAGSFVVSAVAAGASSNLNNKYFVIFDAANVNSAYVWYNVNGQGVNPNISGKISIPVAIAAGASANTIATTTRSQVQSVSGSKWLTSGATNVVDMTNATVGTSTDIADGGAPTGFAISTPQQGVNVGSLSLAGKYFFINASSANGSTQYAVWFHNTTNNTGADPLLPGISGQQVNFASNDSAGTIAAATAAVIAALNTKFSSASAIGAVITVTNAGAGSFVPASDFNTTFTFAVTAPIGTVIAHIDTFGL